MNSIHVLGLGWSEIAMIAAGIAAFFIFVFLMCIKCYRKIPQGSAIIRTGMGGVQVAFDSGIFVFPVLHRMEIMDISVKRIEIERKGKNGLICRDNMRADIKVAFFIKVNNSDDFILEKSNL